VKKVGRKAGGPVGGHSGAPGLASTLGDFTTRPRVLLISAIAIIVGTAGVISGVALLKLIRLCTNLAYFGRFTLANLPLGHSPWGLAAVLVPVGGALIVASALLPENANPFHHLATGLGRMEADEIKAATPAKAEQARQLAQRQAAEHARIEALKESMAAEIGIGQAADWLCAASGLFGQGRNTDYADLRDGLRSTCGVSGAVRQHMMNEITRNLDPGSK